MLDQSRRSLSRDYYYRKNFTKVEIKRILLKSILQNNHLNNKTKAWVLSKHSRIKTTESISKQNNNICLKSGRYKGILKNTNISRHFVKKLGVSGFLQNFKISSW